MTECNCEHAVKENPSGTTFRFCGYCGKITQTGSVESDYLPSNSAKSKSCSNIQQSGPTSCPVNMNANICRLCPSGRYDRERDACIEVIEIGLAKGQRRAGKINWLHYHPDAKCPLGHF